MASIVAAHRYSGKARIFAIRIKDPKDLGAIRQAAQEMAPLVPENSVLMPAPSATARNPAMLVLSREIAKLVRGTTVIEAVKRTTPVPPSLELRRAGRPRITVDEHAASMTLVHPLPPGRPLVTIDNVVTTGATIAAVERIIQAPLLAVVYADARGRFARRIA